MCQLFKAERHHLNALKHMSIFAKLENYVHKTNSNLSNDVNITVLMNQTRGSFGNIFD